MAQAYSERMAREGFFAHVAPDGSDLRKPAVRRGPVLPQRRREPGPGPRAAVRALRHRAQPRPPQEPAVAAVHPRGHRRDVPDGGRAAPGHRHRGVLRRRPAPLGRPAGGGLRGARRQAQGSASCTPLKRSEVLEQIAMDHVRRALQQDRPRRSCPTRTCTSASSTPWRTWRTTAVDFYVTEDPTDVPESQSLLDAAQHPGGRGRGARRLTAASAGQVLGGRHLHHAPLSHRLPGASTRPRDRETALQTGRRWVA